MKKFLLFPMVVAFMTLWHPTPAKAQSLFDIIDNYCFQKNDVIPDGFYECRETGEYAMKKLRDLQKQNPLIGEVRGLGLMIGVELVRDEKLTPANSEAEAIRDALLRQGVLVGVGGVYGNVVRFQPPLIIRKEQIDHALNAFASALTEVSQLAPA